jgi:uncharacterized membrane protein YdjX (TVP38/TMEM64 family)
MQIRVKIPQLGNKILLRRMVIFILVTLLWIYLIVTLAKLLPKIYIPHNLNDVKILSKSLQKYAKTQSLAMLTLFVLVFLFKQTFAIPGAGKLTLTLALLNILAGSIYGVFVGLFLVLILTATGSSISYLLSKHLLGQLVFGRIISQSSLSTLRSRVDENRENLLPFMIGIRMVPLVPGGVVNFSSPYLDVPLKTFFISTFIGVAPYAFICVSAASTLTNLNSVSEIFSFWVILKLSCLMMLLITPLIFKNRILAMIKKKTSLLEGHESILKGVESIV